MCKWGPQTVCSSVPICPGTPSAHLLPVKPGALECNVAGTLLELNFVAGSQSIVKLLPFVVKHTRFKRKPPDESPVKS